MNTRKTQSIVAASLVGIVLVIAAYAVSVNGTIAYSTEQKPTRPSPPPAPLQMWGSEVSPDEAKKEMGFDRLSGPANLPEGVILKSTRAIVSEDGTYRQLTQFYGPESVDSSDKAYIDDFLSDGGLMVLYVEDDRAKPFNWKELGPQLVNESPDKREMSMINGADAIIVKGDKEMKEKSEVMFDIGRTRMAIVSNSFSADELLSIAHSIRG